MYLYVYIHLVDWLIHTVRENVDLKPPLPGGYTHSWERLQESTPMKNLGRQFVAVFSNVL